MLLTKERFKKAAFLVYSPVHRSVVKMLIRKKVRLKPQKAVLELTN
jgi:hypothetical protein